MSVFEGLLQRFPKPELPSVRHIVICIACLVFGLGGGVFFLTRLGNDEEFYMYLLYGLGGVCAWLLSKYVGREFYVLLLIPRIFTAGSLSALFFLLNIDNLDQQNPLKLHPFTIVWLVVFALEFLELLADREPVMDRVMVFGFLTVMCFMIVTFQARGGSGMGMFAEDYVGPFGYFFTIYARRHQLDARRLRAMMNVYLVCVIVFGVCGIIEYALRDNPFTSLLPDAISSTVSKDQYRTSATVGHILFPTIMLTGCFLVRMNIRSLRLRIPLYVFCLVTGMLSQTRALFVLTGLYVLAAEFLPYFRASRQDPRKLLRATLLLLGFAGFGLLMLFASPIGKKIIARFLSDAGSTNARMIQIDYFLAHAFDMRLYGIGGFTDSVTLYDETTGSQMISEIPWINLYFDVGPFLLLLLVFLFLVIRRSAMPLELLMLLAAYTPYASLTAKNQSFYMLLVFAAYGAVLQEARARGGAHGEEGAGAGAEAGAGAGGISIPPAAIRLFVTTLVPLIALFLILGYDAAERLDKRYTAVAELYVTPVTVDAADLSFLVTDRQLSMQVGRHLAHDVVELATSGEVMARMEALYEQRLGVPMPETDFTYSLQVANTYDARIVRITYTDKGEAHVAAVVSGLAEATAGYIHELLGSQTVTVISADGQPPQDAGPRVVALMVVEGVFAALCSLFVFLALCLLPQMRRGGA